MKKTSERRVLLSKLSFITDAKPSGKWQETPQGLFEEISPFVGRHVLSLRKRLKTNKSSRQFLKIFEEFFYLKRILEDLTMEGYVEGVVWLSERIPDLKNIKELLHSAEEKSRPKKKGFVRVRRGENYLVYHEGFYYSKSWLTGKIYKLKTNDIFALFPSYDSEVIDVVQLGLLKGEFSKLLRLGRKDPKIAVYAFLNEFKGNEGFLNKNRVARPLYRQGIMSPDRYHGLANEWIRSFARNGGIKNLPDFRAYVEREAVKIGKGNETREYLKNFSQNIERNFLALENMNQYVTWLQRDKKSTRVYVLRDTISMYECEVIHNANKKAQMNNATILVNRDMLAHEGHRGYWWAMTSQFLYEALNRKVKNYGEFFAIYYSRVREKAEQDPDFKRFLIKLGKYLIKTGVYKNKRILFVDTGVQGSVVMLLCALTTYLKESGLVEKDVETDLRLYTTLFYFRNVYKGKYYSDNTSFIRDVEYVKRQEYLYHYVQGSFQRLGHPLIKLENLERQLLANIELRCSMELLRSRGRARL